MLFIRPTKLSHEAAMIDLKLVQKDPQILADALENRHSSINIEEFRELDQKRRSILAEVEAL